MIRSAVCVLLLLSGCAGAQYARDARVQLAGRPLADVEGCIGIPDRVDKLSDSVTIIEWTASDAPLSVATVPLAIVSSVPGVSALAIPASALAGSLPVTIGGGSCRAIAVVRGGIVESLRYAGPGDSLSGRDALCGVDVVRGCLRP
jgi:hypothetical protein